MPVAPNNKETRGLRRAAKWAMWGGCNFDGATGDVSIAGDGALVLFSPPLAPSIAGGAAG